MMITMMQIKQLFNISIISFSFVFYYIADCSKEIRMPEIWYASTLNGYKIINQIWCTSIKCVNALRDGIQLLESCSVLRNLWIRNISFVHDNSGLIVSEIDRIQRRNSRLIDCILLTFCDINLQKSELPRLCSLMEWRCFQQCDQL